MTVPVFSGFDGSFLGLSGWFIDGTEIQGGNIAVPHGG